MQLPEELKELFKFVVIQENAENEKAQQAAAATNKESSTTYHRGRSDAFFDVMKWIEDNYFRE